MLDNNLNKPQSRLRAVSPKIRPRLFLSLHTMPQTGSSHLKKWLFLGLLIFGLVILFALTVFWR